MVKSQIALDIFQMKALNEIGLNTKDASMVWVKNKFDTEKRDLVIYDDSLHGTTDFDAIMAYTLEDILLKLPYYTLDYMDNGSHDGYYRGEMEVGNESPIITAFELLKHAIVKHPEFIYNVKH